MYLTLIRNPYNFKSKFLQNIWFLSLKRLEMEKILFLEKVNCFDL